MDHPHWHALGHHECGRVVAQVMESLLREAGGGERLAETPEYISGVEWATILIREDEPLILPARGGCRLEGLPVLVVPERVHHEGGEREGASALFGLWLLED